MPAWSSGCSELETMTAGVLIEVRPTRVAMCACVIAFNVHYCVTALCRSLDSLRKHSNF